MQSNVMLKKIRIGYWWIFLMVSTGFCLPLLLLPSLVHPAHQIWTVPTGLIMFWGVGASVALGFIWRCIKQNNLLD